MNVPSLGFIRLRLQLVDLATNLVDFVAAHLLVFVCRDERAQLVFDCGDGLAGSDEALLRSFVLLALEGVNLDLKFEFPALKFVDGFGSGFASDTNAAEKEILIQYQGSKT